MPNQSSMDKYPGCTNFQQAIIEDSAEVQAFALAQNRNVLPLFEKLVSDYKQIKTLSLETNELLKCRWRTYVQNAGNRSTEPYQFPGVENLHIHECTIQFMPSLSIKNRPNLRMQMTVGPGVDQYGQLPIPNDMHVRKNEAINPVASSKAKQQ